MEEKDSISRPFIEIGQRSIETRKLLAQRGRALGACRRRNADRHRFHAAHHFSPAQQIQAEAPRDGDEPRQDRALRIEPLEVDEGPHERLLREIVGVGGSHQSPAETMDGAMKAPNQLVEGRRITTASATREIELCSPIVRIRACPCHTPCRPPREYGRRPRLFHARVVKKSTGLAPNLTASAPLRLSPLESRRPDPWTARR